MKEGRSTTALDRFTQRLAEEVGRAVVIERAAEDRCEILPAESGERRRLEVWCRGPADLEVAFHVPGKQGSPFEQVIAGPAAEEDAVLEAAVRFVADLVRERRVLAWDRRLLRGGRRFLEAGELAPETRRRLAWVVSWRGTWNWSAD